MKLKEIIFETIKSHIYNDPNFYFSKHSFKIESDIIESGYIAYCYKFGVSTIPLQSQTKHAISISNKGVSVTDSLSNSIGNDLNSKFTIKAESDNLKKLITAIQSGDGKKYMASVLGFFGFEIESPSIPLADNFTANGGLNIGFLPVFVKIKGKDTINLSNGKKLSIEVDGGVNFGPSKLGWAKIAERVGTPVLKKFLTVSVNGARIFAGLVSSGILTATGIVVGGVSLYSLILAIAFERGAKMHDQFNYCWWYINAYIAKVFKEDLSKDTYITESRFGYFDLNIKDKMVLAGRQDAIMDAKRIIVHYRNEAELMTNYKLYLMDSFKLNNNEEWAKHDLTLLLKNKIKSTMGVDLNKQHVNQKKFKAALSGF
ncbi:MAG: hypothetical protein JXR61_07235 [Prolixibacteraceae bacterium]|nr:hypothetical protein [Bacteroidales bacterium]MBN2636046.1 hypothetical protein [Prolixibacteraceae bacterium]